MRYFPGFQMMENDMLQVAQDEVDYLAEQTAFLDEGEVVSELSLGTTLEDLEEPARFYVLYAYYSRCIYDLVNGIGYVPVGYAKENWLKILDAKAGIARWAYCLTVCELAHKEGIAFPQDKIPGITYYEGEFRLTFMLPNEERTLLSDAIAEEDEPQVIPNRLN